MKSESSSSYCFWFGQETKLEVDDCPLRYEYPIASAHASIAPFTMSWVERISFAKIDWISNDGPDVSLVTTTSLMASAVLTNVTKDNEDEDFRSLTNTILRFAGTSTNSFPVSEF